jgi:hypothetical protein
MMQWLLPANSRLLAALTALAAVNGCAMAPSQNGAEAPVAGWRVVERIGEARFSPPEAGTWLAVITGRPIAEGSEVTTGPGGRLILAVPSRHISVGPGSRFSLPHPESGDRLEQRAGWLRYRMASAVGQPFRIHTRSLDLEFAAAVVDVRVEQGSTEVTVMEGEVRLATPDGLRRTEIAAGQSARSSSLGGVQLAVRRGPAESLESIEPLVVPAVHPTPSPPADRAPPTARGRRQGATINPARATPEAHEIAPAVRRAERAAADSPGGLTSGPGDRSARAVAAPPVPEPSEAAWFGGTDEPSTGRRRQFERLTEGMVDGVPPAGLRAPAR